MMPLIGFLRGFWRDKRGISAVIFAMLATVLVSVTGMVIDFGHAYWVQQSMQAATDAAAVAAGWEIPNSTAIPTAASYSSASGDKNAVAGIPGVTETAVLSCLTDQESTIGLCTGSELSPNGANVVKVTESASVPTLFLGIVGIKTIPVSTVAEASARGGPGTALNVEIVLDATASMSGSTDGACGLGANASREQCALAGIQALLQGLNPTIDYVGLLTFPGLVSSGDASRDYTCGQSLPSSDNAAYNVNPVYQIVSVSGSNTFKTSNNSKTLNPNSNIVGAVDGAGCTSGVDAVGGKGTYMAGAITKAQSDLAAFAGPHTQNVIVVLSDGGNGSADTAVDFTASIGTVVKGKLTASTTMTVTAIDTNGTSGSLAVGQTITSGAAAGTTITAAPSGGGVGTYTVSKSQAVNSSTGFVAANNLSINGTSYTQNIDQCQQAISAAKAAAAAGTWVYSIAYGSSTATGAPSPSTCMTDTTGALAGLSSCTEMQDIASDLSGQPTPTFYTNGNNGQVCPTGSSISDLVTVFENLSTSLTEPRLIPVNTT
jgi:Flp pilus assembly protein TadG